MDPIDPDVLRAIAAEHRHQVEFRDDGWTVVHPLIERVNGSLFDCPVSFSHLDSPPALGRYWIEDDESLYPVEGQE